MTRPCRNLSIALLLGLGGCEFGETQAVSVLGCEGLGNVECTQDDLQLETLQLDRSPTALAFNPSTVGQLWVTSPGQPDALLVLSKAHQSASKCAAPAELDDMNVDVLDGFSAERSVPNPRAVAFSSSRMVTCGLQPDPLRLAGPTLWRPDPEAFGTEPGGPLLDWLPEASACIGIAHRDGEEFWAIDGADLIGLDFGAATGPDTLDDETTADGEIIRHANLLAEADGGHAGLAVHPKTKILFATDPGNARILMIDPTFGYREDPLPPARDGIASFAGAGISCGVGEQGRGCWVIADGASAGLQRPSGLALWNEHVFVTDAARGALVAFELPSSPPEDALLPTSDVRLEHGALGGLAVDPCGALWIAAPAEQKLVRILPRVERVPVIRED